MLNAMADERFEKMNDDFLLLCREVYFEGIQPAQRLAADNASYQRLVKAARQWFDAGKQEEFYQFAQEGQYFIQLWVAHMLLEYGAPSAVLTAKALAIIRQYAAPDYTLNVCVAQQEAQWLIDYNRQHG